MEEFEVVFCLEGVNYLKCFVEGMINILILDIVVIWFILEYLKINGFNENVM